MVTVFYIATYQNPTPSERSNKMIHNPALTKATQLNGRFPQRVRKDMVINKTKRPATVDVDRIQKRMPKKHVVMPLPINKIRTYN